MNWASIVLIALLAMDVGIVMAKHGEERPPYSLPTTAIGVTIMAVLYFFAGVFG